MQSINARSLVPQVNQWLGTSRRPRVLHVFDRACNLINEHRDILSVVTPQIGDGPFNLVVENEILFSQNLDAGSSVSIATDFLVLGDLGLNITNARLWNPRPDWERLHARKNDILYQLAHLQITSSLKARGPDQSSDQHHGVLSTFQSPISNLSSALANTDIECALKLTSQLAGFGIGLTPAGDDFIMGALYATWIIHPFEVASMLAHEIANTAALLTTSLSGACLRSAGRGEAGIGWHEFFGALLVGDSRDIQTTLENILQIGETSGADAFAGFFTTMMA